MKFVILWHSPYTPNLSKMNFQTFEQFPERKKITTENIKREVADVIVLKNQYIYGHAHCWQK